MYVYIIDRRLVECRFTSQEVKEKNTYRATENGVARRPASLELPKVVDVWDKKAESQYNQHFAPARK